MDGMDGTPQLPKMPVSKVKLKIKTDYNPVGYAINAAQHAFLGHYAETLDKHAALKVSGLKWHQVSKNPYMMAELERLQECAMFAHRAKSTVGNHHRLMDKFERAYDKAGDARIKQGYAGVIARMSDSAMKAAGEFGDDDGGGAFVGVQVVLNFGGRPESVPAQTVIPIESADA
jgi:hypothetical protein